MKWRLLYRDNDGAHELAIWPEGETSPECIVIGLTIEQVAHLNAQMAVTVRNHVQARR